MSEAVNTAAFFDLDKTIIAKSSVLAFGRSFYREGLLSRRSIVKSMYAQIVFMLVGADEAEDGEAPRGDVGDDAGLESATKSRRSCARPSTDVIAPIIFAEALELFDEHHAAGRKVVIVSSAPLEVVQPLSEFLGADEAIGTRAAIDSEGNYTGELEFYAYGPHKAEAMRELADARALDLPQSYAYSDSITDLPMLELVGHPVAVNPDKELARVATRARLGDPRLRASGAAARPHAGAARRSDDRGRWRARRRRRRRRGLVVAAPPQRCRLTTPARRTSRASGSRSSPRRWSRWTGSPSGSAARGCS